MEHYDEKTTFPIDDTLSLSITTAGVKGEDDTALKLLIF